MIVPKRETKDRVLLLLSIILPSFVVMSAYAYTFGFSFVRTLPGEELPIVLFQIFLYALPYLAFWVARQRSYTLWLIQSAAISVVWVWFLQEVNQSRMERTGVNIGAGLILFIAPLLTAVLSFFVFRLVRPR
jgi:hypothetical protein